MRECSVITKAFDELTARELYAIVKLRTDVFFVEQKVDETELDGRDLEPATRHYWLAADDGAVLAYLRTLRNDEPEHRDAFLTIGRVVTRADARGRGLAGRLLAAALADNPGEACVLHAQEYVQGLYAKAGFEPFGDVYLEAGIPHIGMYRGPQAN
ncbi:MAG: GNAT family N-acetyltransferase [Microbacteriaceae bacterium]|nr:GNAT family N-acetyltransferase [Microbacteriaceae bacterium]MCL2795878.1 GNAT family N-acetyltransferase [Microbacteriaceae bacterium]